jgi:hypothetical protein
MNPRRDLRACGIAISALEERQTAFCNWQIVLQERMAKQIQNVWQLPCFSILHQGHLDTLRMCGLGKDFPTLSFSKQFADSHFSGPPTTILITQSTLDQSTQKQQ